MTIINGVMQIIKSFFEKSKIHITKMQKNATGYHKV